MAGRKKQPELTAEEKLQQTLVPEAEQPYKVPDNWCWTYWGNCGEFIAGNAFKKDYQGFQNYHIPFYKVGSLKYSDDNGILYDNSNTINDEILKILKATLIPVNSIIFAKIGEAIRLNRRSINNKACCIDNNLMAFVSKVGVWKYFYFWSVQLDLYDYTNATTVPAIRKSDLEGIEMPLPPLAEQQRIVERIETLFAKLDETKEKLQNTLDTFEIRKTAILHKAFTGELTANWRKHHGLTMDSWEEKTLNDIASYKKGPFGSSITKAMFVPKTANTYKVYEQGNVIRKDLTYGHYYITSEKYQELKGFSVKAGDILISCAGTIGEVYKLPPECEEGVINQALMRVRLNQNIIEGYFCYYFGEIIKDDVIDKSNGTAMKNIPPFKVLKAIQIKLPTINEQTEIVRIVDNLLAKEQKAHSIAQNALAKIDLIKKSILVRAFRGQLATNNPADESAVELLKRVL